MKKPRLTDADRLAIETGLRSGKTVYMIAKELSRPVTTVFMLSVSTFSGMPPKYENALTIHRSRLLKSHRLVNSVYFTRDFPRIITNAGTL